MHSLFLVAHESHTVPSPRLTHLVLLLLHLAQAIWERMGRLGGSEPRAIAPPLAGVWSCGVGKGEGGSVEGEPWGGDWRECEGTCECCSAAWETRAA
jgi:hypothetical protein